MATRLIDLPFTRGIDESVDETTLAPPGMTEMVNYRLTRAGRLEHRLGVADVPIDSVYVNSLGDRPNSNKAQALHDRFLAAGGHGYVASANGAWSCVGSLPRFGPEKSYQGLQAGGESFSGFSCASANGFFVVAGKKDTNVRRVYVKVFDERSGVVVFEDSLDTSGPGANACVRVVAVGSTIVILRMDLLTGEIIGCKLDLSTLPFAGFTADVVITTARASAGFDAGDYDLATGFIISYDNVGSAVVGRVDLATLALVDTGVEPSAAAVKLTTCRIGLSSARVYLAWLDLTTRNVMCAVFDTNLNQVGASQIMGNAPGTGLSACNFHPVIGARSSTSSVVGWTDTYNSGAYNTFRTTFRDISSAAAPGSTYGPVYGYYLASKPFRANTAQPFLETTAQSAVWLCNYNSQDSELDRSYFLMTIGLFSVETNNQACSWELSAGASVGVQFLYILGRECPPPEVVLSTDGESRWQTVLGEAFRGLGTSDPQRGGRVYRFIDGSMSALDRSRCIVPCQGSFAVLGGASRYYDGSRLVELGMSHGPTIVAATPTGGGGMTPGGTYRYVLTIEMFDALGQRSLGYVSSPYSVTLGGGDDLVELEIAVPAMWAFPNTTSDSITLGAQRARQVTLRAYRTAANAGTVFRFSGHNSTPFGTIAGPLQSFGLVSYVDANSDADIADEEAVYVQVGNALSNYRAPPCRFGCEHEGRLIVAGGWNLNEYTASKLFVAGEGVQFTESPAFRDVCPEPITGTASLDGSLILFAQRGVYVVTGDGPTDDGVGSFSKPRKLPGVIGCVDWRSVVTTEDGVYFRAADGIYLLPRGLASPVFVGAAVRNKFRLMPETFGAVAVTRRVSSSVSSADSERVVAWLVGDAASPTETHVYVFSLETKTWSEYQVPQVEGNPQTAIGAWSDLSNGTDVLGFARDTMVSSVVGSILVENPGAGYDRDISGSFEPLLAGAWKTGKIFPFGFGGRGSIRSIRIVGECLAATTLTPTIYSSDDAAGYVSDVLTFAPGRFAVQIPFRRRDLAWVQIQVADPVTGSGNRGAGLRFNGLALEVEMEAGLHRSTTNERST